MAFKLSRVSGMAKYLLGFAAGIQLFFANVVFAAASGSAPSGTIGEVASNLQQSFGSLAEVITAGAYIAGMGFVMGAIFKFKAHKDAPTQIPIGTPIALLFIGAAMIFLPQVFSIAGTTLFGSTASVGGIDGVTSFGNFQ